MAKFGMDEEDKKKKGPLDIALLIGKPSKSKNQSDDDMDSEDDEDEDKEEDSEEEDSELRACSDELFDAIKARDKDAFFEAIKALKEYV